MIVEGTVAHIRRKGWTLKSTIFRRKGWKLIWMNYNWGGDEWEEMKMHNTN
jgi:hypothetical protein